MQLDGYEWLAEWLDLRTNRTGVVGRLPSPGTEPGRGGSHRGLLQGHARRCNAKASASVKTAAAILGVNVSRLNQLVAADRVPYEVHSDGRRIYRREQLLTVANAREARWPCN